MKFYNYLSDTDLNLMVDESYDFSRGQICLINEVTYIAINIFHFNTKRNAIYAVFEWNEKDFQNSNENIQEAEVISDSIIRFANNTIQTTIIGTIPLADKRDIQSILSINKGKPLLNYIGCIEEKTISIKLEETSDAQKNRAYTINTNGVALCVINNRDSATRIFRHLNSSILKYIAFWFKSMK